MGQLLWEHLILRSRSLLYNISTTLCFSIGRAAYVIILAPVLLGEATLPDLVTFLFELLFGDLGNIACF